MDAPTLRRVLRLFLSPSLPAVRHGGGFLCKLFPVRDRVVAFQKCCGEGVRGAFRILIHFQGFVPCAVTLGKKAELPSFGWDCEYGEKVADIWPFRASKFLVSNGEFFEFVSSGGYHERSFWTDEVF